MMSLSHGLPIGLAAVLGGALAAGGERSPSEHAPRLIRLRVDFAAPRGQGDRTPLPGTAKEGWWPWVVPDWDLYRSDLVWEDGQQRYPAGGPGLAGSGVHAAITCHYEGIMTLHVAGMRRWLAGGLPPEKRPIYEPICNTWIAGSDFPYNPSSDLLLAFYDLPPGRYRLLGYHNSFNGRRFGDNPTGVEYAEARRPEPPMPAITVYPVKTAHAQYFAPRGKAEVKGKSYADSERKIVVSGKEGSGGVRQTRQAQHVPIQQVTRDAELRPSVTEFVTDGSPLIVVFAGGCCKPDDLRPHRQGGYAVLNAFELIQLAARP